MHMYDPASGQSNGGGSPRLQVASSSTTTAAATSHTSPFHHFATRLVHEGSEASQETGAVINPITLSTTYKQSAVGVHKGYEYSRSDNPNRHAFETLIASLELPESTTVNQQFSSEKGTHPADLPSALAFSSGSAVTAAITNTLVKANGHIISVGDVYGGTYRYFTKVAVNAGIQTTFLDISTGNDVKDMAAHRRYIEQQVDGAFRPETQLVWIETPTNPTLSLIDIGLICEIAHRRNAVVVVDNTFLSPYYQRPLELGADIVVHSVTKYINGHSDVIMGVLVTPNPTILSKLRFYQNAGGAVPSSFDSWLAQRGAKTLALRMLQHGTSALTIARWLEQQPFVRDVIYPGLEGHNRRNVRQLAWRQLSSVAKEKLLDLGYTEDSGFPYGGMISFRLKTDLAQQQHPAAKVSSNFLSSLRVFTLAESLGGVESLAELPSLMTHAALSEDARSRLGIDDELIRLSVGIEDVRDLQADLQQASQLALEQ